MNDVLSHKPDISLAHWLAVEGVQPSIPQNPTAADSRNQELVPKGQSANPHMAAMTGNENVTVKPLVKHVLSKELQLYFEKVCSALLDEMNNEYRVAALASIRSDPGLHQLVPYFVQFIAEKVTHNLKNLFVLTQIMLLTTAMLENPNLYIDPYVSTISIFKRTASLTSISDRFLNTSSTDMSRRSTPRLIDRIPSRLRPPPPRRIRPILGREKVQQIVPHAETPPRPDLLETLPRSDQASRLQLRRHHRSASGRRSGNCARARRPESEGV